MEYQEQNYALLKQILEEISLFLGDARTSSELDLEMITKIYKPYSAIEDDEVAHAICWCVNSLQALKARQPVRCLEEILSFAESVLKRKMAYLHQQV